MTNEHSELAVQVLADPDIDDQDLAELTFRLRSELLDLDVEAVEAGAGQAPADAKGVGFMAIGALVVRLVCHPDVLRTVVSCVGSWVGRQRVRSVKLTLDGDSCEVTGLPSADLERLIDLWIARHADTG